MLFRSAWRPAVVARLARTLGLTKATVPAIPAFCDSCGTAFSSGIVIENSSNISFTGGRSGPCPKCGGMGHVPDGVFNVVGNTIEILAAPARTVQELTRLAEILRSARSSRAEPKDVALQIEKELPALSPLMQLLPANRSEWYAFLAVLLAIVQVYLAARPPGSPTPPNVTINQVIDQTLINEQASPVTARKQATGKVGRNERCPCGSGFKYKKCCDARR